MLRDWASTCSKIGACQRGSKLSLCSQSLKGVKRRRVWTPAVTVVTYRETQRLPQGLTNKASKTRPQKQGLKLSSSTEGQRLLQEEIQLKMRRLFTQTRATLTHGETSKSDIILLVNGSIFFNPRATFSALCLNSTPRTPVSASTLRPGSPPRSHRRRSRSFE